MTAVGNGRGDHRRDGGVALLEIAPREDTRLPVAGRPRVPGWTLLFLLPAVLLAGSLLAVPLAVTFVRSWIVEGGPGVANYLSVLGDGQTRHAIWNTLQWILFAPAVCVCGGLLLALLVRYSGPWRSLLLAAAAAPFAVSAFVTGLTFRLLFDPDPDRGTVSALVATLGGSEGGVVLLDPSGIAWVLGFAFVWGWLGATLVVLGTGAPTLPPELRRVGRAYGIRRQRWLGSVVLPALRPVIAVALLTVLVAAARVFDLVLAAAPGSVQNDAEVVGLHWWRWQDDLGAGASAALAVLPAAALSVAALATVWLLGRWWPAPEPPTSPESDLPRTRPLRLVVRISGALIVVASLAPLLVLLLTSLRSPRDAATGGWWQAGWGLESYRAAFASGELTDALGSTAIRATVATALLLLCAVPAAYAMAWGALPRAAVRTLGIGFAVLAVVPVQAVADPLSAALRGARLAGAPTALTLLHVAFGIPFAVLLLRAVFRGVPQREVMRARHGDPNPGTALLAVVSRCWPALLAVGVFEFVQVWNDFVVGLLLGGPENNLVTLVIQGQARQFGTSWGVTAAGALATLIVPLVLVLTTGRWVARGFIAGMAR